MIPQRLELTDIQQAFRDFETKLETLLNGDIELHGRRVVGAGTAVAKFDYVTKFDLDSVISGLSTVATAGQRETVLSTVSSIRVGPFATQGSPVAHPQQLFIASDRQYTAWVSDGATWIYMQTFQVNDAATAAVSTILNLAHRSSGTPAANFGASLAYQLDSSTNVLRSAGLLDVIWTTATNGSEVAALVAKLMNGGAAAAEVMRVLGNGNVGIGTSAPVNALHVHVNSATGAPTLRLTNSDSGATSSDGLIIQMDAAEEAYIWNYENTNMYFGTNNTARITILSVGRVGVGTTIPTAVLHLKAGTATASTAPLKLTSGTNLTAAEAGAVEWDGTNLYVTQTSGPTRITLVFTSTAPALTLNNFLLGAGGGAIKDAGFSVVPVANGGTASSSDIITPLYGRYTPLFDHFASVGNVGTGEDTLYSDTIAAAQLAANGDKLFIEYGGTFVSSATATRQIRLYFDATGAALIFDTGALTLSLSSAWTMYVCIIRVSASVVRYSISLTTEGAALAAYTAVGEVTGLTLSAATVLKLTAEAAGVGAATDDIVAMMGSVAYSKAA